MFLSQQDQACGIFVQLSRRIDARVVVYAGATPGTVSAPLCHCVLAGIYDGPPTYLRVYLLLLWKRLARKRANSPPLSDCSCLVSVTLCSYRTAKNWRQICDGCTYRHRLLSSPAGPRGYHTVTTALRIFADLPHSAGSAACIARGRRPSGLRLAEA